MKPKIKDLVITAALLFFLTNLASATFVSAGSPPPPGNPGIQNPDTAHLVNISDFPTLLVKIVQIFLGFAGAIAVIFLMLGGFQYVSSRGNEEGTEKAKKTITSAIIGIVVIVMAYAIVAIVNTLLTGPPPT